MGRRAGGLGARRSECLLSAGTGGMSRERWELPVVRTALGVRLRTRVHGVTIDCPAISSSCNRTSAYLTNHAPTKQSGASYRSKEQGFTSGKCFMLTVHLESSPPTITLLCHGRIVFGVEAETLRRIATSRTERRVVVDLQHVHAMDAAGLGLLAELHCWARERAVWLSITRPSSCVQRLVALTCLDSVLDIEKAGPHVDLISRERSAMTA